MIDRDKWKRLEDSAGLGGDAPLGRLGPLIELGDFLVAHSRELRDTLDRQEAEIERLREIFDAQGWKTIETFEEISKD